MNPARLPAARRALETSITLETNEGVFRVPVRLVNPRAVDILEPELVCVPAGPFTMGSNDIDDGKPAHTVDLPEYWIGKHPVTNEEYAQFVRATGRAVPEGWQGNKPPSGKEKHPVVNVSWHDAVAYCRWLSEMTGKSYRLPTEAEWEKAARGTDRRQYPWGDQWDAKRCNTTEGGANSTTPVGQYPRGASPYGALDMAGNVWEWCSSLYQPYPYRADDGREDVTASAYRVLRGGSWSSDRYDARCACRYRGDPDNRYFIGFRCCACATSSL